MGSMRLSQAVFTVVVVALAAGGVASGPVAPTGTVVIPAMQWESSWCQIDALGRCYTSQCIISPCTRLSHGDTSPAPIVLKTPITITITTGDVTLEGGTLTLGPDGKTYEGGVVTVRGGSVVLDPRR